MWPYRPEKLTDALPHDELELVLRLGAVLGSTVAIVERSADGTLASINADASDARLPPDPFCTYFRHGEVEGRPAFGGADAACSECERSFGRRFLTGTVESRGGVARLRCHMGLTDYQVPVAVGGKVVAGLIAGRRVESEDDRHRIRKIVGKLGKLTRAEAESGSGDRTVIEPASEKARDRLIGEIADIPPVTDELLDRLRDLGAFMGKLASRQIEGERRAWEDAIVERIDARPRTEIRSFGDLRRDISLCLEGVRDDLKIETLAFFALTPKELDDEEAHGSLIAESGFGVPAGKRLLELHWSRLPSERGGVVGGSAARGLEAVSTAMHAIQPTKEAPEGLKDRLTKSIFFAPVEMGMHFRAALAFGKAQSPVPPDDRDYLFLARIAKAVTRRYYAIAAEIERRWLADHLASEGAARKQADAARREAEAGRKELEKTAGFTFFDARKLVDQVIERARKLAEERGVELDARGLVERLNLRGDRPALGNALRDMVAAGIDRTLIDPDTRKGSPLRVFLRRTRDRMIFGVEAIGEPLEGAERRRLFTRQSQGNGSAAEPKPETPAAALSGEAAPTADPPQARPTLVGAESILRRHEGFLRATSERLHRDPRDGKRWIGKTTFVADLPLPVRKAGSPPAS